MLYVQGNGAIGVKASHLDDVLPGAVHITVGAETSHDHGVEFGELERRQRERERAL